MIWDFNPERDYVGDMRRLVDELTDGTSYFPPMVAHKVVTRLQEQDPELLKGWLFLQAEHMIRSSINERDRSVRSAARRTSRSVFPAQETTADGTRQRAQRWLNAPLSLSTGARMALRDMGRVELVDAGQQYETRAQTQGTMAAFLNALARKVGEGTTVSDHYSEEDLESMWSSLTAL